MITRRIGKDFTEARNNTMAWNLHRKCGMALTTAFRAVNFANREASGSVNAHFLRKNLGLSHCR